MEFSRMKRRELLALCAEHGLAARGSKDDLAASLAGAISAAASAAAAEKMVDVMVGKGCLKRSGGSSGAVSKKVTFSFEEKEEGGENEILLAAKVSRRGCKQKNVVSAGEGVVREVCANAQVIGSMTNAVNLDAGSRVGRHDDLAEEEREVVGATVDRRRRSHENPKHIATSAQAGVSRRSTKRPICSTTADSSARSQNAPAEKEGEVIGGAGYTKLKRKMTGTAKVGDMLPATTVSGRESRRMCTEKGGSNSSVEVVTVEIGADPRETWSKRNVENLCAGSGDVSLNILAEAEEDGEVVHKGADSKWKQKTLKNAENIAAKAHVGISCENMRSSSLPADDVMSFLIVKKKTGSRAAELGVDKKSAEVQDFPAAASYVIIESKRSQSEEECCEVAVQKSAKVEVSDRVTTSCSVNAAVVIPVAISNKNKMKTETVHLDRVVCAVLKSDVHRDGAPVTRSLRNIDLQNTNTMLEETHVGKKLRQSRGSASGRNQQLSSSVEEEEQAAAPCKSSPLLENAKSEKFQNSKCEGVGKRPPFRRSTRNCVVAGPT